VIVLLRSTLLAILESRKQSGFSRGPESRELCRITRAAFSIEARDSCEHFGTHNTVPMSIACSVFVLRGDEHNRYPPVEDSRRYNRVIWECHFSSRVTLIVL
jgi:hypothetical protein